MGIETKITDSEMEQREVIVLSNTLLSMCFSSKCDLPLVLSALTSAILSLCKHHDFTEPEMKKLFNHALKAWKLSPKKEQQQKLKFRKVKHEEKDAV